MIKKISYLFLLFIISIHPLISRTLKELPTQNRIAYAHRISEHIKIDGVLSEDAWIDALPNDEFLQYEPFNGSYPSEKSLVKILYDDNAIYIGATLSDDEPNLIYKEFGQRDKSDNIKADAFSILISPYNDGINYLEFIVSASGVQTDIRRTGNDSDRSWDAVWESSVSLTDSGWFVEIKIPFSALRFSSKVNGNWGLNFRRLIKRYNEWSSWNPIDNSVSGIVNQSGELSGIKDIDTPIRLSFSPYISGYIEKHPENSSLSWQLNGGMDLQFGLTESFTLDMTLIPDFGQVKSDEKVLNISPYEVMYDEQRPFFNEGMDLFDKGGIFYSRRIGTKPKQYNAVSQSLGENDTILSNPQETALINATKVSGRTSSGLGIGFLNAFTSNTYADIKDTLSKETRRFLTQGFTNYNMIVLDQTLKNNSYVSLANTNLHIPKQGYTSNVTATDFVLRDKRNSYAIAGVAALSQIFEEEPDLGYKYNLGFHKTSGNILFEFWNNTESDDYNPNDMGYIKKANEFTNGASVGYKVYKPFWRLLNWTSWIGGYYTTLHNPMLYTSSYLYANFRTFFTKSYLFVHGEFWMDPRERHDYDEPRVDGRMLIRPRRFSSSLEISSDYRKSLAMDVEVSYWKAESMDMDNISIEISPRVRFNNKFMVVYEIEQDIGRNDIGYVGKSADNSNVYMGLRDVSTLTNTIDVLYSFSANAFLSVELRHYWRWLDYSSFHLLNPDGTLSEPVDNYMVDENINFNLFNIDLSYQWNFAPGSVLSIVWKNAIEDSDKNVRGDFFHNFGNVIESSQINSISFRLLYYLDYNSIVRSRDRR